MLVGRRTGDCTRGRRSGVRLTAAGVGGAAGAVEDVVAGEGEHCGVWVQGGGGGGEAVGAAALAVARVGEPQALEAAFLEPLADLWHQVRLRGVAAPPAPRPHD